MTDGVTCRRSLVERLLQGSTSATVTGVSLQQAGGPCEGTGGTKCLGDTPNTYSFYAVKDENPPSSQQRSKLPKESSWQDERSQQLQPGWSALCIITSHHITHWRRVRLRLRGGPTFFFSPGKSSQLQHSAIKIFMNQNLNYYLILMI